MKLKIAITHGDINGVGYEVILKALEDARIFELCTPIVYGSAKIASHYRKALGIQPINMTQITDASQAHEGAVNILNVVGEDVMPEPGQSTEAAGRAALASLERAVADLNEGLVDALVTAPINKHNIQSPDFTFPGHTEYLEARAGDGAKSLMVLCSENLRVALATTHMAIKDVPGALSVDSIVEKLNIFNRSLHRDFGVDYPRIAVLALNPHAGEEGMLGTEENEIIAPAIAKAKEQGIAVFGPYAADGFFGAGRFVKFDGVLAMNHDQRLAPFKTMSMGNGINFTAGLPVVRTSPDHGTGYDIAGSGEASPESMLSSIYAAIDIVRARAREDEAHANPLRRMYRENESKGRKDRD